MIPYGKQDITREDIDRVIEVLESDYITQGPRVPEFENVVAMYCGAQHGVAVNSATSALHIACLALDVGPGDWLWTSPISFVASANCGLYCGAKVGFVDIDPETYNLCPIKLEEKLKAAANNGTLPKVLVAVHLAGQSCDMASIAQLAQEYDFKVIEDASHAIGGRYRGEPIGGCQFSDITVFSFHPVKIITTAEGGLATTNSTDLRHKMDLLRSHGITREPEYLRAAPEGGWYYEQVGLGYNYRLTEIQAALGISQMQRLDLFIEKRHELAARYDASLRDLPLTLPQQHADCHSAYHLYPVLVNSGETSVSRAALFGALRDCGVGVNVHYIPIYKQPHYQDMKFEDYQCPVAEDYYARALSLPLFPNLSAADQRYVEKQLSKALAVKNSASLYNAAGARGND